MPGGSNNRCLMAQNFSKKTISLGPGNFSDVRADKLAVFIYINVL